MVPISSLLHSQLEQWAVLGFKLLSVGTAFIQSLKPVQLSKSVMFTPEIFPDTLLQLVYTSIQTWILWEKSESFGLSHLWHSLFFHFKKSHY